MKYNDIRIGDTLYLIECADFAGFGRKRLPELHSNCENIVIKKWRVRNEFTDHKELANDIQSSRNRSMTRRIDEVDFDILDQPYFHSDEPSAINAAINLWQNDILRTKCLIITTTINEKIYRNF